MAPVLLPLLALMVSGPLQAAGAAADLARQIREAGLDPEQCYRVRDLRFARDEVKVYFTDGHLIFGKPVNGRRVFAVFSGEIEGGDGEILLLPPSARERRSLARFAKTPNLNEHLRLAAMVFTDDSGAELLAMAKESGAKPSPEHGNLLAGKWGSLVRNLAGSFEVRLVEDLLSSSNPGGFVYAAVSGATLGNFDVVWDSRAREQITLGRVATRDDRHYFDVWTSFEAQSWRRGRNQPAAERFRVERVSIDATLDPSLKLHAATRLRITPLTAERVLSLELSPRMEISEASIDGEPAEVFAPESLRSNLLRDLDNHTVLVVPDKEMSAGKSFEVTLRHAGNVIVEVGPRIYSVGSRAAWYPKRPQQFAPHEIVIRYPKDLDLVATGDLVEESEENGVRIARRRTTAPIRFAGFNVGDFQRAKVSRGPLAVEVVANRNLEDSLRKSAATVNVNPSVWPRNVRRPTGSNVVVTAPSLSPPPTVRLQELADEIAGAFEGLAARFGAPPLPLLTASPIPGPFGQGFPGLLYLSTMSYLAPKDMPLGPADQAQQVFFSEILHAHEVAHQWWGNGVVIASNQDEWLMEALANYSALWLLERKKGAAAVDAVLDQYRSRLLERLPDGGTVESLGPVTMGRRLMSSLAPNAWAVITYEKGTWILHMLRRVLGDAAFEKMLASFYHRHRFQTVSTAQFEAFAREIAPAEAKERVGSLFEQWVYGTGIPDLKLQWKVSGQAPRVTLKGTLLQSQVEETFSVWAPVEIRLPQGRSVTRWVQSGPEPVDFTVQLPAAPVRVTLAPSNSVLLRK